MEGKEGDSSTQSTSAEWGDVYRELQKQVVDGDVREAAAWFLQSQDIPAHHNTPSAPNIHTVPSAQWRMGPILAFGALRAVEKDGHKALRLARAWEDEQESVHLDMPQKTQARHRKRWKPEPVHRRVSILTVFSPKRVKACKQ